MIYTGYFAKTNKYIKDGLTPVSVAGKTPDFFEHPKWVNFAPRKELFMKWKRNEISNEDYSRLYKKWLDKSISENALEKIKLLSTKFNIVLCCYEKPFDFCHRHVLAEWLSQKINIEIKEYKV